MIPGPVDRNVPVDGGQDGFEGVFPPPRLKGSELAHINLFLVFRAIISIAILTSPQGPS